MRTTLHLCFLALFLSACDSGGPTQTADVTVISWDLYRGFDMGSITSATDEADLRERTFAAYRNVLLTNFPNRARRIADEVEAARPDLIALQEVALYRTQSPSNFAGDPSTPDASQVRLDFLTVLLDSLAGRGLDYRVVANLTTSDFELPATTGSTTLDIRFTDRDVILAAVGISTSSPLERRFMAGASMQVAGFAVPFSRGMVSVVATKSGLPFTVVSTQLHDDANGGAAQRAELVASLPSTGPVLLTGGLGTTALTGADLLDGWLQLRPSEAGPTCCLSPTIDDEAAIFSTRPDRMLARGGSMVEITRLGEEPRDRLVSGLWPSDHAGLGARILFRTR